MLAGFSICMDAIVPSSDLTVAQSELAAFLASRSGAVLGTRGEDGFPELSVAPFVREEDMFAMFLSDLAPHTRNLRREPRVEVLLLDDEAETRQPFARQRVSLSCSVEEVAPDTARSEAMFALMERRFGGMVPLLRGLPDFHLFLLKPYGGRYVAGFGKAYRLEGLSIAEHLRA